MHCLLSSRLIAFRIRRATWVSTGKRPHDVWAKVREELGELEAELENNNKERSTIELGDFIFSVINAARLYHLNPDNALEHANRKFISRFTYIEKKAKEEGKEHQRSDPR